MTDAITGSKSHPHTTLVKHAIENFGLDSTTLHLLTDYHQRFWAMASLTQRLGMPIHRAVTKVMDHPPPHAHAAYVTQLPQLFNLQKVKETLAAADPLDIASIMRAAGFDVFNHALSPTVNLMLQGAHYFLNTRAEGLADAIQQKQTVGVEIEFTPQPGMTRDHAYVALKARLEAAGKTVQLLEWGEIIHKDGTRESQDFIYGPKPGIFPTIFGKFTSDSIQVSTQLLEATSSIMHTLTRSPDDSKRLRADAASLEGAAEELYARVAKALNTGSVDSVKHMMAQGAPHYTETRIYLLKDDTGDIAKVEVDLQGNNRARLTGNNCLIYDNSGTPQSFIEIDAPGNTNTERFDAIKNYLEAKVKNRLAENPFAKKVDRYGAMRIDGIDGEFRIVVEAHPDLELITPILTPDQGSVIKLLVEGLRHGGFEGTRAANVVGVHVHAGLPLLFTNAMGQDVPTIAPAVNLMRAFGLDAQYVTGAVPTDPNRDGFIHTLRPELIDLFHEPNYVTDPTDPLQILRVCADLVRLTRTKYTAVNLDNYISFLLGAMLQGNPKAQISPLLEIGLEADKTYRTTYTSPTFGKLEYIFQTVQTEEGINVRLLTLLPDLRPTGKYGEVLEYVDLIRIKASAWKPTAEFRIFNTDLRDSDLAPMDMEFVAAYVAKFAKPFLLSMDKIRAMQQRILNMLPPPAATETVPSGQKGFITLDAMTLGAMSAVNHVINAFHATASFAKGGAVFLLGDVGSELVLGHWDYFKTLSVGHVAKDYALLTVGSEPVRAATTAAFKTPALASLPPFLKSLIGRAAPLLGALSAQQYGNTGTVDLAHLPQAAATVMGASALVQGGLTVAGHSARLTHLAQIFKLAKVASGPTFLGLAATSVAEFAIIKTANRLMEDMFNAEQITTMTEAIGGLLTAARTIPEQMSLGHRVSQVTVDTFQKELDAIIAALENTQTLEEQRAWASYHQDVADLKEWRRAEMGRTLDGTFSYGEISETYEARLSAMTSHRDRTLTALTATGQGARLPVDPAEDWSTLIDAVDEDQLAADVDMDGNPRHSDATPLRYQALLDRNTHVMVAQLKQFSADWAATIRRLQNQVPTQPLPLQLAQR
jgi:hypothetical protein